MRGNGYEMNTWCTERTHDSGCGYREWGNIGCFGNPIVVSNFIFCNILYGMVNFFIRGYKYNWRNDIRTSCVSLCELFYLCIFELTLFVLKLQHAQQFLTNKLFNFF